MILEIFSSFITEIKFSVVLTLSIKYFLIEILGSTVDCAARWITKLGFKDFNGIDYINNPKINKSENLNRKYELKLPIPKITHINKNGKKKTFKRLFKNSKHIGYGLPDL